jgi:hypothetical protein
MKLRIHKNSLRLRLSQIEVDEIGKGQSISEQLEMGDNPDLNFKYSLTPLAQNSDISAEFSKGKLSITVPKKTAEEWANSDLVSLSKESANGLTVLIEKDFQCLHKRPDEDESQNFPNPMA